MRDVVDVEARDGFDRFACFGGEDLDAGSGRYGEELGGGDRKVGGWRRWKGYVGYRGGVLRRVEEEGRGERLPVLLLCCERCGAFG